MKTYRAASCILQVGRGRCKVESTERIPWVTLREPGAGSGKPGQSLAVLEVKSP